MRGIKTGAMEGISANSSEDWAKWWQGYGDTVQHVLMYFHIKNVSNFGCLRQAWY